LLISIVLLQLGCSQTNLQDKWEVIGISGDSLSLSGYGDLKFKPGYEVEFDDNKINITSNDDETTTESYDYRLNDDQLIIIYSDYGLPIELETKDENKLILYGGGWGNS